MANIVDPDQMQQNAASDWGLHCLQSPVCPNTKGSYGIFTCFLECHCLVVNLPECQISFLFSLAKNKQTNFFFCFSMKTYVLWIHIKIASVM